MKLVLIPLTVLLITSCSPKITAPKGNYPKPPIVIHSDKAVDKVWDNLIDFFAQKGLSIKIIDRSSGLIISEKTLLTYAVEDKKGQLKNTSAFVVLPRICPPGSDESITPSSVTGEWNVRVKADGAGTSINVNLLNFLPIYGRSGTDALYFSRAYNKNPGSFSGQTTGVFEKTIADIIK